MEAKIQEKFKWTMMESDECCRIGSTKRRKRWKEQQQQPRQQPNNKNINDKNYNDKQNNKRNEIHFVTHILKKERKEKHKQKSLFSLLLKKCYMNWKSCFCYMSWSNFRWLAIISVSMKAITLQKAKKTLQQHEEEKEKKESKRKHNNYSECVQSSVYVAESFDKIKTTRNITPTLRKTLSSTSSAFITSTLIPTTTTTKIKTNFSILQQKLPIFSRERRTPGKPLFHQYYLLMLLLLLAFLNIFQHHHAADAALIPPQEVNSSAKEALVLFKQDQSRNNVIVDNNNHIQVKNEGNFEGVLEGARDIEEILEKLDNHTLKSYSIIDGNSLELEQLENKMLEGAKRSFTTTIEPIFDFGMPLNITARTGQAEAVIKCRVEELHDKSVSWIRKRDLHILSVGTATYTSDKRFEVTGSKDLREWSLHVKSPQTRDSGIYECQINTEPKISMAFQLNIIEISPDAKAMINGPADLHFKVGSAIILSCVVMQPSIKDIGPIYWYRGEHMITPFEVDDNSAATTDFDAFHSNANEVLEIGPPKGIINAASENTKSTANEITQDFTTRIAMESQLGDTLKSRLRISNAQTTDTGNYTCQPTTASSASVLVHVINDENPAAMQKSAAVALHRMPDTLRCTITAVVVTQVMLIVAFVFQQNFLVITIRTTTTTTITMINVPKTKAQHKEVSFGSIGNSSSNSSPFI